MTHSETDELSQLQEDVKRVACQNAATHTLSYISQTQKHPYSTELCLTLPSRLHYPEHNSLGLAHAAARGLQDHGPSHLQ